MSLSNQSCSLRGAILCHHVSRNAKVYCPNFPQEPSVDCTLHQHGLFGGFQQCSNRSSTNRMLPNTIVHTGRESVRSVSRSNFRKKLGWECCRSVERTRIRWIRVAEALGGRWMRNHAAIIEKQRCLNMTLMCCNSYHHAIMGWCNRVVHTNSYYLCRTGEKEWASQSIECALRTLLQARYLSQITPQDVLWASD